MMKIIIGLSGRIGSGKGTVAEFLVEKYDALSIRYSHILEDILKRLYIPVEREALQIMGSTLRSEFGDQVLVNAMKEDLDRAGSPVILIDGIRYPNEVEMLRGFENTILFYLDAPAKTRFERIVKRGQRGEENIDFEDFQLAEKRETEKHLDRIRDLADYHIDNSGSIEETFKQVEKGLKDCGL